MNTQGLYPQQIYHETADVGKTVKSSKRRAYWKFAFGDEELEYEVTMTHSLVSGKKVVNLRAGHQQSDIHESKAMKMGVWTHNFNLPGHSCRVQIDEDNMYDLFIDNCPFHRFEKRGVDFHRRLAEKKQAALKKKMSSGTARKLSTTGTAAKKKVPVKKAAKTRRPSGSKGRGNAPAKPAEADMLGFDAPAPASSGFDDQGAFDPFNDDPAPAPAAAAPAFDAFGSAPPQPPAQQEPAFDPFGNSSGGGGGLNSMTAGLAGLDFGAAPAPAPAAPADASADVEDPFASPEEPTEAEEGSTDLWALGQGDGLVNLDGNLGPKASTPTYKPKQPTLAEMQARQPISTQQKQEVMKSSPQAQMPMGVQQTPPQQGMGGMGGVGMGGVGMQQPMQPQNNQGMGMGGMGMGMPQQGMGMGMGGMDMQQGAIPNPYARPQAQAGGAAAISAIGQAPQYPQQQQQQQGGMGGIDPFSGLR